MRRSTRFDANQARRQLLEENQHVPPLQLTPQDDIALRVNAVNLKHRLRDIETDRRDRLHGWLLRIVGALTAPLGGGAVHSIMSGLMHRSNRAVEASFGPVPSLWTSPGVRNGRRKVSTFAQTTPARPGYENVFVDIVSCYARRVVNSD